MQGDLALVVLYIHSPSWAQQKTWMACRQDFLVHTKAPYGRRVKLHLVSSSPQYICLPNLLPSLPSKGSMPETIVTHWDCIKTRSKPFTLLNNNIYLHRLLGLRNSECDQQSLSWCHLQPPTVRHQSYRHRSSQRKCPPLHTQEPYNHWYFICKSY